MGDAARLQIENRLLKLAAQGKSVLAGAYGGRTIVVTQADLEGVPIAIDFLDLAPSKMRKAIRDLAIPSISFYDLPRLSVTIAKDGMPDTEVDAAAVLMAAWQDGHSDLFDELCVAVWSGWTGYPGAAIAGPVAFRLNGLPDAGNGDDFTNVDSRISRRAFADWLRKLRNSDDEDVAHFGVGLTRSHRHFRNHDLEGNRLDKHGEIVDDDDGFAYG